jgi:hypothetical protein
LFPFTAYIITVKPLFGNELFQTQVLKRGLTFIACFLYIKAYFFFLAFFFGAFFAAFFLAFFFAAMVLPSFFI